jgi:hypothetical protein
VLPFEFEIEFVIPIADFSDGIFVFVEAVDSAMMI